MVKVKVNAEYTVWFGLFGVWCLVFGINEFCTVARSDFCVIFWFGRIEDFELRILMD